MKKYTWNKDKEQEMWLNESFDTIDECIEDAKSKGHKVGDIIVVGEIKPYVVGVCAEVVLDMVQDDAYEACGEVAEDWLDYKGNNLDSLAEKINGCINDWLKETSQEPTFSSIINIREVIIK